MCLQAALLATQIRRGNSVGKKIALVDTVDEAIPVITNYLERARWRRDIDDLVFGWRRPPHRFVEDSATLRKRNMVCCG